jgi:hypothetical protein
MPNLFDAAAKQSVLSRLQSLAPRSPRQWGKMNVSQMLAHCTAALERGTGDVPSRQMLIGKIFAPFARESLLGDKPFSRNSPTDPGFIITDDRDFDREKARLTDLVTRFCERGPVEAGKNVHSFLGRMSGDEWGILMYKHLDHHLRQFGA